MKIYKILCLVLLSVISVYSKSAVIIVHGTWASDESWYQPCGNFFKSIQQTCLDLDIDDRIIPFSWSGGLNFTSHHSAAYDLSELIREFDDVVLIGHSHGGTVAVLASNILGKTMQNFGKIKKLYLLGMPIPYDMSVYPDMNVIDHCYNLFSFGDQVQRIGGMYNRIFVPHERLANIAVMIDEWCPTHSGMHSPIIGIQLLKIHNFFAQQRLNNFENFDFLQPAQIKFLQDSDPVYTLQLNQRELLDWDLKAEWAKHHDMYRKINKIIQE